jgi:hypothetical protein
MRKVWGSFRKTNCICNSLRVGKYPINEGKLPEKRLWLISSFSIKHKMWNAILISWFESEVNIKYNIYSKINKTYSDVS